MASVLISNSRHGHAALVFWHHFIFFGWREDFLLLGDFTNHLDILAKRTGFIGISNSNFTLYGALKDSGTVL